MCVDIINGKNRLTYWGDFALHRNHTVLDVAHELFRIKIPVFVLLVPSLVLISAAWWSGSAVQPQNYPGQRQGYYLGKNEHGKSQGATPLVRTCSRKQHTTLGNLLIFVS